MRLHPPQVSEDGVALTWVEAYAQYYEDGLGSAQGAHNVRNDLTTQYLSAMCAVAPRATTRHHALA